MPIGRFAAEVTGCVLGTTDTGKDQVAITFKYTGPEGREHFITAYRYFTERALEYTVKDLDVLGWNADKRKWNLGELHEKSDDNPDGGFILGNPANITVEEDEYEGKVREVVRWINAPGGGGVKNKVGAEGQETLSNFTKRIRSLAKGKPVAAPAPGGASGESGDDDCPF
jgi:hypothetical protein